MGHSGRHIRQRMVGHKGQTILRRCARLGSKLRCSCRTWGDFTHDGSRSSRCYSCHRRVAGPRGGTCALPCGDVRAPLFALVRRSRTVFGQALPQIRPRAQAFQTSMTGSTSRRSTCASRSRPTPWPRCTSLRSPIGKLTRWPSRTTAVTCTSRTCRSILTCRRHRPLRGRKSRRLSRSLLPPSCPCSGVSSSVERHRLLGARCVLLHG